MTALQPGRHFHRLGVTLSWWGLDSLALPALRAAARSDAGFVEAQFVLGETLLRCGAWRQACESLREVVVRVPDHAEAWGNVALACARQGAVERAVAALERLATLGPGGPEPLLLAAALLKKQRRWADAIATFRRAAEISPSARTVRFFLGEEILGRREWEALVAGHLELHQAATTPQRAAPVARPLRARVVDAGTRAKPLRVASPQHPARLWRRVGMLLVELYHVANGRTQLLLGRLLSSQHRPHEAIRSFRQASLLRQQRLEPSPAWAARGVDLPTLDAAGRAAWSRRRAR